MKVLLIKAHNFRKYDDLTLDLSNHHGINLILGENGKGKSSIYFAFMYALYGVCPDGSKGDEVIKYNSKGGTYAQVVLELNHHTYTITRYRKDKTYKNKVILELDDKDITLATIKETDNKILELIKVPEDIMLSSLVFSPEKVNTFINATDKGRKAFLEQITNTNIYKQAYELVRDDLKNANTSLSQLTKDLDKVNALSNYQKSLQSQYEANLSMYNNQVQSYQESIQQFKLDDYKEKFKTYQDNIELLINEVKYYQNHLAKIKQTNQIDKTKLNQTNQRYYALKTKQDNLYQTIKDNLNHLNEVKNSPKSYCSLCGNLLDEEHKQNEINNLVKSLQNDKATYLANQKQLSNLTNLIQTYTNEVKEQEEEQSKALELYQNMSKLLYSKQSQLNTYQNRLTTLGQSKANYDKAKSNLDKLVKPTKPKELDKDYHDELTTLNNQINQTNQEINQLEILSKVYSDQGAKSIALAQAIPLINQTLSPLVGKLTNNKFNAKITSTSQTKKGDTNNKLDLVITNKGNTTNYDNISSGEKRRISIALNLAFMKYMQLNSYSMNFVIFDEIFDNLDEVGINDVIGLIKDEIKAIPNIFIITHNNDLKYNDNFDKIITIKETNNFSF